MVTLNTPTHSLLAKLRNHLTSLYGARLREVVLFGSYARGEARPDSDVDVLVVLSGTVNSGLEISRISGLLSDLSLEYDTVISCLFMDEARFQNRQGPLLRNIRREGIIV
ncbi:MAG: nucleotidyltransferase domain-containing protein [Cyanobacteria bacterium P01_A01_bin.123]